MTLLPISKNNSAEAAAGPNASAQAFAQLFKLESDVRRARATDEIDGLLVNEGRRLLRARQVFVVELARGRAHLKAATGLATIDRTTPMARWIEAMVSRLARSNRAGAAVEFSLPDFADAADPLTHDYPFRHALWEPHWSRQSEPQLAALYLREHPWTEAERAITSRLAETIGHARAFAQISTGLRRHLPWRPLTAALCGLALFALVVVRVPVSVLAPLEIVPRDAEVVAMPLDGIVQRMLVEPSDAVQAGMPLVQLADTILRSRAEVLEREVLVAEARVEKATSLAFTDPRGRQELGIARAELDLKQAEAEYAEAMLAETLIRARSSGIAIFSDPKELEGRPLSTGDRLMLIGREGDTQLRISLPVADSIVLRPGLKVRAFLDSDPLSAVEGTISHVDYQVKVDEHQIASYRLTAYASDPAAVLKLGARGTAQILGDPVPLLIYLLRRPIVAVRQWAGL